MQNPQEASKPDLESLRVALCASFEVERIDQIPVQLALDTTGRGIRGRRFHYLRLPALRIPNQPVALPRPIDSLAALLRALYKKLEDLAPPIYLVVGAPLITPHAELPGDVGRQLATLQFYAAIWRPLPPLPAVEHAAIVAALRGVVFEDILEDHALELYRRTGGCYESLMIQLADAEDDSELFRYERLPAVV